MGSKRFMLGNGLGELIREQLPYANRVVDPFCGAGSVVYFVAENSNKKIIAGDLQKYATVLANAVIGRTKKIDPAILEKDWLLIAENKAKKTKLYNEAVLLEDRYKNDIKERVKKSRQLCERPSKIGPIWNAYGGHYYSPRQALIFDYLIKNLPEKSEYRDVCLAAMITAATRCAASPGHTAQPFQPTDTASKFIEIAWNMDPIQACKNALKEICPLHSSVKGLSIVSDAKNIISQLKKGDLVIVDPPYSGVQYSRFYHVLETIARGIVGSVEGVGRYPALADRPQSAFSNAGQSVQALEGLLSGLSKKETTVILTFPKGVCSNGLSGDKVIEVARKYFDIDEKNSRIHAHDVVIGKFSTLGGNNKQKLKNDRIKSSRVTSEELILLLKPRVV